jgi:hypothetical protein
MKIEEFEKALSNNLGNEITLEKVEVGTDGIMRGSITYKGEQKFFTSVIGELTNLTPVEKIAASIRRQLQ